MDTSKLASDSVTGLKILSGTIDTAKLNATIQSQLSLAGTVVANSIDTSKIINGAVDTSKLASDAVTTIKIANAAVDTSKLAADSVLAASILNGVITGAKLASATIDTGKIKISGVGAPGRALCDLGDGSGNFGHCSNSNASICDCQ